MDPVSQATIDGGSLYDFLQRGGQSYADTLKPGNPSLGNLVSAYTVDLLPWWAWLIVGVVLYKVLEK